MQREFHVSGMSCQGCVSHVHEKIKGVKGVISVDVSLEENKVLVKSEEPITATDLQNALGHSSHYRISDGPPDENEEPQDHQLEEFHSEGDTYYCPMRCEGDRTYEEPGDCPVCGMDLVKEASAASGSGKYVCPMHPEVVSDSPGSCPKCGMDLVFQPEHAENEEDDTYKKLLRKFVIAIVFTVPIFVIAMSEMIPNNPLYDWMPMIYWNWVQLALSIPVVFYATWMFFKRAYSSIIRRSPNMFTLIGLGAGAAWIFSVLALLFPSVFPEQFMSEEGTVHVYFEAATVILTLVLLGQLLEARAHQRTNSAIKELLKLAPNQATRIGDDGEEEVISVNEIVVNDQLKVRPGEKIPVDGVIVKGSGTIDESMITGEPIPVDKDTGDEVTSGTINGKTVFVMEARKVGKDTLLSQIIEMVNEASRSRAPIQNFADRVSAWFVPIVVLVSMLTFAAWSLWGPEPRLVYALVNAIAVLIIACPCALGLATPMSVMVGVGKGAQNGVLIKSAEALQKMNEIDTLIIDKTGTITQGHPEVRQIESFSDAIDGETVERYIVSVNSDSEHPLAEATSRYGKKNEIERFDTAAFESITGKGVKCEIGGKEVALGNRAMMETLGISISEKTDKRIRAFESKGLTVPILSVDKELAGCVVFADPVKDTSKEALKSLYERGIRVIMMTGDNENTAASVAKEVGLKEFQANCLPEDKMRAIEDLQAEGDQVAMAGDGINDAPALAKANVGIAMGTGTDVAIESAGVTLVKGDLRGIVKAFQLSEKVMRNIKQNLFFALVYNTVGVPVAAGVLYPFFGLLLSPMIAALAMSFSSVSVIANALRLKRTELYTT